MTWREIAHGRDRIRWRRREGYDDVTTGSAYIVERWDERMEMWREMVSGSARDWFAMGLAAGLRLAREGVQEELPL
jgi:hypothetical protein